MSLEELWSTRELVNRLTHHARVVEECGHLNAARWMREAAAHIEASTREPNIENQVSDEWADDLAAAVIEQGRDL